MSEDLTVSFPVDEAAEKAWVEYRDTMLSGRVYKPRQMRKREFISGFYAAARMAQDGTLHPVFSEVHDGPR